MDLINSANCFSNAWTKVLRKVLYLLSSMQKLAEFRVSRQTVRRDRRVSGVPGEMGNALHYREFHRASRCRVSGEGKRTEGEKIKK